MISLSIIGTGNVAFHLANAFSSVQGVQLNYIVGRSTHALTDFKPLAKTTTDLSNIYSSKIILIAVSDSSIAEVSKQIKSTNSLILHTSGSTSLDILNLHNRRGVFYPLQTFSKNKHLLYKEIPFCIEALLQEDVLVLTELAEKINAKTFSINSTERASLHLAAVFSNNFCNHILTEAKMLCEDNNVSFDLLKPLMTETISKAFLLGPENSQTGPAKRGDLSTLEKQRNSLTSRQLELYNTLTHSILKFYER